MLTLQFFADVDVEFLDAVMVVDYPGADEGDEEGESGGSSFMTMATSQPWC